MLFLGKTELMEPDLILIENIQRGDVSAFKIFFDGFYPSLYHFATKFLNDKEASQDIVQEAFIYFWNKKSDIYSIPSAKSYLYKYVKNRCLNYIRDRHKEIIGLEKLESEAYSGNIIIEQETYEIIYRAIQSLSPQGQRVIELTLDGLKNHEIATQLGISLNTVKTIKLRAFKSLRSELKEQYFTFWLICMADKATLLPIKTIL